MVICALSNGGGGEKKRERDDAGLGAVEPAASALRRLMQEIENSRPALVS